MSQEIERLTKEKEILVALLVSFCEGLWRMPTHDVLRRCREALRAVGEGDKAKEPVHL